MPNSANYHPDQEAELLAKVCRALPLGILVSDADGTIILANPKFNQMLGYDQGELHNQHLNCLIPERFIKSHDDLLDSYIASPSARPMGQGRVFPILSKSGEELMVEVGLQPLTISGHPMTLSIAIETTNPVIKVAATKDPLTGLPNRYLFLELAEKLHISAIKNQASTCLLFIDLDNFKTVNDSRGHSFGDEILVQVSDIISKYSRDEDIAGRLGGDEFLMCFYDSSSLDEVKHYAESIRADIKKISQLEALSPELDASIGVMYLTQAEKMNMKELIDAADKHMYQAKRAGKGCVVTKQY